MLGCVPEKLLCFGCDDELSGGTEYRQAGQALRQQITEAGAQAAPSAEGENWLELDSLVQAELTSEDPAHPIESAPVPGCGSGWWAQQPGKQTICLLFDQPHSISRIPVEFQEHERQRTQEFVLRWSPDGGASWREIVRQQYNFSPPGNTRELEDYFVDLEAMTMLELQINPDISGGGVHASLEQLRLA